MKHSVEKFTDLGVTLQLTTFRAGEVAEHHAMLHVEPRGELFAAQYDRLMQGQQRLQTLLPEAHAIVKRYFLSDAANQAPLMQEESHCSVSLIQQPPLDGSKVAVWIYMAEGMTVATSNGVTRCSHNGYTHLWQMGCYVAQGDSAWQTEKLLTDYEKLLQSEGGTLADNCLRTWFYVRDVDTQYAGMVKARRENFMRENLTPDTHYISSTGIQGLPSDTQAIIQLDTYAITGLQGEQQHYVKALSHLNPTIEYGVTFERGTVVEYGDRAHCYISGTASINNRGEVVHVGDVRQQTLRMWENVEKLLEEGNMQMSDIAQMIVYLRDTADYEVVRQMFAERFPAEIPLVITLAPVCRPEWLIEMECIAIKAREQKYRAF